MSVYKRSYSSYTGPRTPTALRFLVLTRYGLADVWSSRITNVLFTTCLVPFLFALVSIYVMNSDTVRLLLNLRGSQQLPIDNRFFLVLFQGQCWLALVLAAWTGPRLMSADLANNALPIILSRPLDRAQYVVGKLLALFVLLSAVTWVPALVLFGFQAELSKTPWAMQNRFIASGMLAGAVLWIVVLSLIALTLATWVKWRVVATGLVFGALLVPAGVGGMFNLVLRTNWGSLLNVPYLMIIIWQHLLHITRPIGRHTGYVPPEFALAMLILVCTGCVMALHARIRAREVVRG